MSFNLCQLLVYFHQTTEIFEEGFHVVFRIVVERWQKSHSCSVPFQLHFLLVHSIFSSSFFTFFLSLLDASIEILLACSFKWFEVLKRRSITRHSRNPEEDAIAKKDGDDNENNESDESTGKTSRAGNCRPNSSTRIVRWVLMDYSSKRKPVDQRKFIVTAFAVDVYSYLDKRLDIDVMSTHAWSMQSLWSFRILRSLNL